jgi:predicted nuclease of predicted toxin-antitoxin system
MKPPDRRIRFHLDENVAAALAVALRLRNIDVTTTNDARLAGASDHAQLSFATTSARVIVTQDDDLLRLHAEGVNHAGIVFCLSKNRKIGELVRGLALIHNVLLPDEMHSRVEYI